jgi:cytochrome oxidase Cu insertion factor (SCO1/SenC/PrrC family)
MRTRISSDERWALGGLVATFAVTAAWWALALWPVSDAPTWLERTRYVCFGVNETGLPDAGGWVGLIGGPLGMLGIVLVGWNGGVRALLRDARRSVFIGATLSTLALGVLLMVGGATIRVRQAHAATGFADDGSELLPSTYPRLDRAAPPLELTAHDGVKRSLAAMRGQPVLLTFAYAHCTTICPVIVRDVLEAKKLTAGTTHEPVVMVVTLDPWRDTPARLESMARDWAFPASGAWMLGGSVAEVEAALDAWEVPRSRNEQSGEVTHPSLAYIIDAEGRIAFASTGGAETLAELLRRLDASKGDR